MTDTDASQPAVGITRHAAQAMLHHALDSRPGACCGLLFGSAAAEPAIRRSMSMASLDECVHRLTCPDHATAEDEQPVGLYRSFPAPETTTADMLSGIPAPLRNAPDKGLVYAAVSLCTEGRLEIHLFSVANGEWHERPLSMLEDGALYHARHNG